MSKFPLTQTQLKDLAPTLFTEQPHYEVSDKYHFIPTIEIVNQIIAHNWHPVSVSEASVRDENKEGYQQHYVRFRHFEDLLNPKENAVELLLFNSHDRTKSFSISAGIYRFICANGLVLSDNVFESYKIKHLGDRENDVTTAVTNITNIKSKLEDKLTQLSSINLSQVEKESFAKSTIPLRFEDHLEVDFQDLLIPLRAEDCKDDLYTTLNIIQENLIRGNVSGVNKETGRRFTSKEIKSISKDIQLNKGVWDIAERIALIKEPQYQIAA
jgi:hypothetical protein